MTTSPAALTAAALATREAAENAAEAHTLAFDADFPGWETREVDPEDRTLIDYSDVADPEAGSVRGYGGDHRVYVPGAHE